MSLSLLDFLNGCFSLIFVCVSVGIGLKIASKFFEIKQRMFFLVGIGWAGICSPWWPSSTAFVCYLITGKGLEPHVYFFIGVVLLHFFMTIYLIGLTEMILHNYQKLIIVILIAIGVAFETYFLYNLLGDPSQIGYLTGLFDITYAGFVMIYLIFCILLIYTFNVLFSIKALKSESRDIKLKGKLLIIAINRYFIGAILDAAITLTPITLILTRSILISSSILFYLGFLLPNFIKNRMLKST